MSRKKTPNLHGGQRGAALAIRVYPGAQHNEITEITKDGAISIMLHSSGQAAEDNRQLIDFLAGILSVRKSRIEIVAGEKGRAKLVSILDISTQTAHERIINNLS